MRLHTRRSLLSALTLVGVFLIGVVSGVRIAPEKEIDRFRMFACAATPPAARHVRSELWQSGAFQSEGHRLEAFTAPDAAMQDKWMVAAAKGLGRAWKSGPVPEMYTFNRGGFPDGLLENPKTQFIAFPTDAIPNDSGNIDILLIADTTTREVWLYLGF